MADVTFSRKARSDTEFADNDNMMPQFHGPIFIPKFIGQNTDIPDRDNQKCTTPVTFRVVPS